MQSRDSQDKPGARKTPTSRVPNKVTPKKPAPKNPSAKKSVSKKLTTEAVTSKIDVLKNAIPAAIPQKNKTQKSEVQKSVHPRTAAQNSGHPKNGHPANGARKEAVLQRNPPAKGAVARPSAPKSARPAPKNAVGSFPPASFVSGPGSMAGNAQDSNSKRMLVLAIVGILLVIYLIGAFVFSGRFVPNSKLGAFDISFKTSAEVQQMLDDALDDYSISISGEGFSYTAYGADAGLDIDYAATLDAIHRDLNSWKWPLLLITGVHNETSKIVATSSADNKALDKIGNAVDEFNATATPPTNASLKYVSDANDFTLVADVIGTQLDRDAVTDAAAQAMVNLLPTLALNQDYLLQPNVKATDPRVTVALQKADLIATANISLTFNNVSVGSITGETLVNMVAFDSDVNASLDQGMLKAWVTEFAKKANTAGSTRTYKRDDGKEVSVTGGVYGWEIDATAACEAITQAAKEGLDGSVALPCLSQGATYTAAGQRDWGTRYLDVDISQQYVRFYGDDGSIIWEAECITGKPDGKHDTVQGVWYVTDKESPYTLVGYIGTEADYESRVTYWMPFEGNSIGFHDATWQYAGFGGELYAEGYGSHGCVNLSYSDAQALYGLISIRDVVVVHE